MKESERNEGKWRKVKENEGNQEKADFLRSWKIFENLSISNLKDSSYGIFPFEGFSLMKDF